MKVLERIGVFERRIRGWLPRDPIAASVPAAPGPRVKSALQSLAVSLGAGFVVLLGALYSTQWIFGFANNALFVLFGCAVVAAVLYVRFSMRSLNYTASVATTKVARNAVIALLAAFLFTIATSSYYVGDGVNILSRSGFWFWFYFQTLMTGPISLWAPIAFLVVTVFSFNYSRMRVRSPVLIPELKA
jgi:hypothetical protein